MKKIYISIIMSIILISSFAQDKSSKSIIISNSYTDITHYEKYKIISCYFNNIENEIINNFLSELKSTQGLNVLSDKNIENPNRILFTKIRLENNFDKEKLMSILNKYSITHIIIDGKPTTIEEYFNSVNKIKSNGIIK